MGFRRQSSAMVVVGGKDESTGLALALTSSGRCMAIAEQPRYGSFTIRRVPPLHASKLQNADILRALGFVKGTPSPDIGDARPDGPLRQRKRGKGV